MIVISHSPTVAKVPDDSLRMRYEFPSEGPPSKPAGSFSDFAVGSGGAYHDSQPQREKNTFLPAAYVKSTTNRAAIQRERPSPLVAISSRHTVVQNVRSLTH